VICYESINETQQYMIFFQFSAFNMFEITPEIVFFIHFGTIFTSKVYISALFFKHSLHCVYVCVREREREGGGGGCCCLVT